MPGDAGQLHDYCGKGLEGCFESFVPLVIAGPIWDCVYCGLEDARCTMLVRSAIEQYE